MLEALLAMTILGITVTGILTTFSAALLSSKLSEDYALASIMIGELHTYARANLLSPMEINQGEFENHPGFYWSVEYAATGINNLYQITFAIHWMRGGRPRTIEQVTLHYFDINVEYGLTEMES